MTSIQETCNKCNLIITIDDLKIIKPKDNINFGVCPYCYNKLPTLYRIYIDIKIDKEYKESYYEVYGKKFKEDKLYDYSICISIIILLFSTIIFSLGFIYPFL